MIATSNSRIESNKFMNVPRIYDLAHQLSPAYSEIGDQELYVRIQARDTFALDYSKDWANRGKQTDPQW